MPTDIAADRRDDGATQTKGAMMADCDYEMTEQEWADVEAATAVRVILGSELPADEAGWSRDACWYGNDIGGDEALTCSWSNRYHGPDGQAADVDYYIYGEPSRGYGVVECVDTFTVDDEGDRTDDEGEQSDNGLAPSFDTPAAALAYARSCAMTDSRWWFSL